MARWKIAGINFEHFHMGDNLRMAVDHPDVEVVGVCDEDEQRMDAVMGTLPISADLRYSDFRRCIDETKPDIVLLCPNTGGHGQWVADVAPFGTHVVMEKPFAATLADADRMMAAMAETQKQLAINWPLAWYPSHCQSKRLIVDGTIGDVLQVHFYDGNRGPLWHSADKVEMTAEQVQAAKPTSWFYQLEHGGGSLLDYLGYGTTLGTWFMDGRKPIDVTCTVDQPQGLEVDEHSVTVARYETGLSKFETRWGTFTDPWTHQPQPKCGFVIVGSKGTISSYDYDSYVTLQDASSPEGRTVVAEELLAPFQNPIQYVVHCLENGESIQGPLSVEVSRVGQQIVDTAVQSAREKRTVKLIE